MSNERFIVDDCGTLIDMTNGNNYDYVNEVCGLLNGLYEENKRLQSLNKDKKLNKMKPDWTSLNFDNIYDWCQEFICYCFVEDELSDVGVHCEEVEEGINTALIMLKNELDKMKLI